MNPASGNVYDTDLSFMEPTNKFYTPLLANTSMNTLYPTIAMDSVPGHLVPYAPFEAYPRPYQLETLGSYETDDFNSAYQIYHQDYTTQRILDGNTDQLVGQQSPFVTESDFNWTLIEELLGVMPSVLPCPPPLSVNLLDSCMRSTLPVGSVDLCDSLMQAWQATAELPWDTLCPPEPGFDGQYFPQSLREDPTSDTTRVCKWNDNGLPCNALVLPCGNPKHFISQHLQQVHNVILSSAKSTLRCLWDGCTKELKQESIVRHIVTVHLHITSECKGCGTLFARQDSLQRHIKNSCGAGNRER